MATMALRAGRSNKGIHMDSVRLGFYAERFRALGAGILLPGIYLVLAAALAAAVAYPVFLLSGGDTISQFRTLVSRGGQVILILGLYPVWRALKPPPGSLGFSRDLPRQFGVGFGVGVLMLGLHVLGLVALEVRAFKPGGLSDGVRLASLLLKATTIGILVALVEETLFRGALFGLLRRPVGRVAAVVISAFYFAALHFLGSHWEGDVAKVGVDTGFRIALDGFANLSRASADSFLGLFAAGALLASVRAVFPLGLGYCIGLHAAWVFVIKAAKPLTYLVPGARWGSLVGGYDGFVGYLSAAWVSLLIVGIAAGALRADAAGNE
jgi:membrane protease YdiL (CAAX protease family)